MTEIVVDKSQITAQCKECVFFLNFKEKENYCTVKRVKVFPQSVCENFAPKPNRQEVTR